MLCRYRPPGEEAGYSLIELTIVVAFGAIVTAMAMMTFEKGRERYQLKTNATRLVWQIERARSLAIRYNQTLTLGFTVQDTVFGLTCDCPDAASELPSMTLPADDVLSAHPTLTLKGNGTIQTTSSTITLDDQRGRQVTITISNAGRTSVGETTASSQPN